MAKIQLLCALANASDNIRGIGFSRVEGAEGMVSETVDSDSLDVQAMLTIPGYSVYEAKKPPQAPQSQGQQPDPELEELRETARSLNITFSGRTGKDRLRADIDAARKAIDDEVARKAAEEAEAAAKAQAEADAAAKAADAGGASEPPAGATTF